MSEGFLEWFVAETNSGHDGEHAGSDCEVNAPDLYRIARLLRVLHEIDESLIEVKEVPEARLSALIAGALHEAGFVDPVEGRLAIAIVLELIGMKSPATESLDSWEVLSGRSLPCACA